MTEQEKREILEAMALLKGGDTRFLSLSEAQKKDVERFLAAKGETPANLLAAWNCTRDRRWLERAGELFPDHPMVLLALIVSGDQKRLDPELIRRLDQAAPNNPLPKLYEASQLFSADDKVAALAAVKEALARPGFYTWMNESMEASKEFLVFTGVSPVTAEMMSMAQIPLPFLSMAQGLSKNVMALYEAQEASNPAANAALLEMTYKMGQIFATPEASRTLIGQLVGISIEHRALVALPPDIKPDWLPYTPAQRLAELNARKNNVPKLTASAEWLFQQQDPMLFRQYLSRFRKEGEMAALTWLEQQRPR
jgi:hypothetical protein